MKISQLLYELDTKTRLDPQISELDIEGIADNSKDVGKGYAFVAITGFESDGHQYIEQAIEKGAAIVIGEKPVTGLSVPYLQVQNSRKALGRIARNFYGNPSSQKVVIGITGTNGKTTTSYMLQHLLESSGKTCSVIGTIQNIINGQKLKSANTTPSSLALHKLLSLSRDEVVIMEVSSHGLSQYRLEGIELDYCLFTNLHHEHLDYHDTMEDYFQAKLLMFKQLKINGKSIVNVANFWGQKLADILKSEGKSVYTIGESVECNFRIQQVDSQNSLAIIEDNGEIRTIFYPMNGIHNLYNTLMAYATSRLLDISSETLIHSTYRFKGVEGRFEVSKLANGSTVVVDYAHTPDAISYCLKTARLQGAQRIIHIFGFRGDRDSSKRKIMLTVAAEWSDRYILTFDDLNTVSEKGMTDALQQLNEEYGNSKGTIIIDRTLAIKKAITESKPGDWIIITGKGHEKYQQPYELPTGSDRETIEFVSNQLKRVNQEYQ
ncbi:UDP-N-acetylmuramoyl-L-alanyl-D-glutamate--2,6-diaminopimelate ligase [Planococcus sp. YIM B11945]|uniref:UDP-N-acetylmuramoyl-L-alanyl-D-glutamate--2, 6-diaminopimelate ligase n=1 Tax=Planococcus sp. YIM B11945 TaxID=3435410 RepID=UPI003D7F0DC8